MSIRTLGPGVRATDALEHAFFKIEPEREYTDATLLQYPDVPIPPPTMPQDYREKEFLPPLILALDHQNHVLDG